MDEAVKQPCICPTCQFKEKGCISAKLDNVIGCVSYKVILKSCPFCGGKFEEPKRYIIGYLTYRWRSKCENCGVETTSHDNKKDCVEAINLRVYHSYDDEPVESKMDYIGDEWWVKKLIDRLLGKRVDVKENHSNESSRVG